MRILKSQHTVIRAPGAKALEQFCEIAPICCDDVPGGGLPPADQCVGLPPWPDTLYLTLTGFTAPYVCDFAFDAITGDPNWEDATSPVTYPTTKSCTISNASTWRNGTYRLSRVTGSDYLLTDRVKLPNTGVSTAGLSSTYWRTGYPVVRPDNGGLDSLAGIGCTSSPPGGLDPALYGLPAGADPTFSPGGCAYQGPECAFDAVYCDNGSQSVQIGFSPRAAIARVNFTNALSPDPVGTVNYQGYQGVNFITGPPASATRAQVSLSYKTMKQCLISLACTLPASYPPSFLMWTYIIRNMTTNCSIYDVAFQASQQLDIFPFQNLFGDPSADTTFDFPTAGQFVYHSPRIDAMFNPIGTIDITD